MGQAKNRGTPEQRAQLAVKKVFAYHEAGHTLMMLLYDVGVEKVDVKKDGDFNGCTQTDDEIYRVRTAAWMRIILSGISSTRAFLSLEYHYEINSANDDFIQIENFLIDKNNVSVEDAENVCEEVIRTTVEYFLSDEKAQKFIHFLAKKLIDETTVSCEYSKQLYDEIFSEASKG